MHHPFLTNKHLTALRNSVERSRWYINENLWSYLVASLIAEEPNRFLDLFCGTPERLADNGGIWCEAEPLSTRSGAKPEGNTVVDIAFGHVSARASATNS